LQSVPKRSFANLEHPRRLVLERALISQQLDCEYPDLGRNNRDLCSKLCSMMASVHSFVVRIHKAISDKSHSRHRVFACKLNSNLACTVRRGSRVLRMSCNSRVVGKVDMVVRSFRYPLGIFCRNFRT